ncbi:MAG: hypothetical protein BWY88_00540 [Synergistetes bacterium ADurb.Bin520]|nr:MAG: hypothetical protein BWY88_00540 [Synergistetes bacterium ADurb.Bin520]
MDAGHQLSGPIHREEEPKIEVPHIRHGDPYSHPPYGIVGGAVSKGNPPFSLFQGSRSVSGHQALPLEEPADAGKSRPHHLAEPLLGGAQVEVIRLPGKVLAVAPHHEVRHDQRPPLRQRHRRRGVVEAVTGQGVEELPPPPDRELPLGKDRGFSHRGRDRPTGEHADDVAPGVGDDVRHLAQDIALVRREPRRRRRSAGGARTAQ